MSELTVGSLFTGIGGIDLGLERAGMTLKWQVEIDDYCTKVLAKHWPDVERFRDVREVGAHNLVPVDLICGGFPCQPHSLAGRRKGKSDERHLWPEYRRIVDELRPTWVLGENVPGIRTTALDDIILDLEGMGYTVGTFDIPACAVGAPHLRHRFFIVAHASSDARGEPSVSVVQGWEPRLGAGGCGGGLLERGADADVAHAEHSGPSLTGRRNESQRALGGPVHASREDVAHADGPGREEQRGLEGRGQGQWAVEPNVGRVADGIPHRVDRLRGLGNAVVPQVAEMIGRMIIGSDYE